MTHQASNLFLRSTSEFHDSREGHALQRLVDACFGRELRNVMEKKLQLLWGGLAVEYELKKLKVLICFDHFPALTIRFGVLVL